MVTPTKTTTINNPDGSTGEAIEFDSKNSVELTNTVKDGFRISAVKVYANDPLEAARIAVETAQEAMRMLQEAEGL